jgi:hypothetical protein
MGFIYIHRGYIPCATSVDPNQPAHQCILSLDPDMTAMYMYIQTDLDLHTLVAQGIIGIMP